MFVQVCYFVRGVKGAENLIEFCGSPSGRPFAKDFRSPLSAGAFGFVFFSLGLDGRLGIPTRSIEGCDFVYMIEAAVLGDL